jgi:hypothetical protein
LTLRAFTGDSVPRQLHSARDSRDRLTLAGIERSVEFLRALVERVDRDPSLLDALRDVTGLEPRVHGPGRPQLRLWR